MGNYPLQYHRIRKCNTVFRWKNKLTYWNLNIRYVSFAGKRHVCRDLGFVGAFPERSRYFESKSTRTILLSPRLNVDYVRDKRSTSAWLKLQNVTLDGKSAEILIVSPMVWFHLMTKISMFNAYCNRPEDAVYSIPWLRSQYRCRWTYDIVK